MTATPLDVSSAENSLAWRRSLPPLLLLLLGVLLLFRETFWGMTLIWLRSETFAHCLFVLPISCWLIWRQRSQLALETPRPAPWVLLPMVALAMLWVLGELVSVNAVTQLAVTAMLVAAVLLLLGERVGVAMMFPLGFVFFAVPMGEFLMPLFMEWTADFTVLALRLSGIPVYREGLNFVIPSGNWSVVEACSGIRYLMASVVVGSLFAYLNYRSLWRRWVFAGVSILVPVVANWLRAYLIVMLGHVSGNELATGADHLIYGWIFFGVVMMLMFMIGARWREDDGGNAVTPAPKPIPSNASTLRSPSVSWILALGTVVFLSVLSLWLNHLDKDQIDTPVTLSTQPQLSRDWTVLDRPPVVLTPSFQNASAQQAAWYVSDAAAVGLHMSYYRQQHAERKLVSSQNVLVTSENRQWVRLGRGAQTLVLPSGEKLSVRTADLRPAALVGVSDENNVLVWQLYWVDDHWTSSDVWAKLYGAWGRLMGRGDDAAVLVFYAQRGPLGDAASRLERFTKDNLPLFQAQLRQLRDGAKSASVQ